MIDFFVKLRFLSSSIITDLEVWLGLMRIRLNKRLLLVFLLLGILLLTLLRFYPPHHLLEIRHFPPDDAHNDTRLYFETDISFKMRLKLQEKIRYGGAIKEVAEKVFSARGGV